MDMMVRPCKISIKEGNKVQHHANRILAPEVINAINMRDHSGPVVKKKAFFSEVVLHKNP